MDTKFNHTLIVNEESDLTQICATIANYLPSQLIIGLNGNMGTGKTTFIRYLSAALGSKDWVNSPTYSIIQTYSATNHSIVHVDLYRCRSEQEIDQLDLESIYNQTTILAIEWADKLTQLTPDMMLYFETINNKHTIRFSSSTQSWLKYLNHTNSQ